MMAQGIIPLRLFNSLRENNMNKIEAVDILRKKRSCIQAEEDECDLCISCKWYVDQDDLIDAISLAIDTLEGEER